MNGFSWAIIACLGTFVYRLYAKNPKQFVENWSRFLDKLDSLFDPGGREAAKDGETDTHAGKGPPGAMRGGQHGKSNSVDIHAAQETLKQAGKPGAPEKEDENLQGAKSAGEGEAQDPTSAQTPSKVRTSFS
jgi:hypothetical protein